MQAEAPAGKGNKINKPPVSMTWKTHPLDKTLLLEQGLPRSKRLLMNMFLSFSQEAPLTSCKSCMSDGSRKIAVVDKWISLGSSAKLSSPARTLCPASPAKVDGSRMHAVGNK